jgi:hypothetical protein
MTYGLNTGAFIEDGPTAAVIEVQASRSTARAWRALDPERRFSLVTRALKPANDLIDAYPLAL